MRPLRDSLPGLRLRFFSSALLACAACGCGGSDDGRPDVRDPSGPGFDPDVDPVTIGDWYRPDVTTTWQWQLTGELDTSWDVDVYDVDLFDTSAAAIADLHDGGSMVICYFSAGSSEDWREDFDRFLPSDMGWSLDGWEGERWLDVTSENVLAIMLDRLDLAVAEGCDGVEPDNVDAFANGSGFALTAAHQLGYDKRIANEAHERGLAVLLKNDGSQASELVDHFDGSLGEQCHEYDECDELSPFTDAGKPILNAEYADDEAAAEALATDLCPRARAANTRTLILPLELDGSFRVSCD